MSEKESINIHEKGQKIFHQQKLSQRWKSGAKHDIESLGKSGAGKYAGWKCKGIARERPATCGIGWMKKET